MEVAALRSDHVRQVVPRLRIPISRCVAGGGGEDENLRVAYLPILQSRTHAARPREAEIHRSSFLTVECNEAGRVFNDLPHELRHVVHLAAQGVVVAGVVLHEIGQSDSVFEEAAVVVRRQQRGCQTGRLQRPPEFVARSRVVVAPGGGTVARRRSAEDDIEPLPQVIAQNHS